MCARMLSALERDDLDGIFLKINFPLVRHCISTSQCMKPLFDFQSLLESCIVYGVWLSLNLTATLDLSVSVEQRCEEARSTLHPLFEV